ncbi:Cu/Pi carrier [Perkinsus olseni]|uniref:Cu/Pi carrier n=1 Tax=Perkinsus olseni TaxID=32597 RepID=A0A7J6T9V3_PEROL|nr:Cu/Pi carrier [Perkinsus olseni]
MSTTSSVAAANSLTAATNPPKWNSRYAGSVPHTLDYYWKCLLGGAVACGTTHTSMCPVDVVKVNMQIDPSKYTSLYQGWKSILHEEGLRGVTKGWSATCVGYTFQGMFKFGLNEVFKDIYNNMVGEENSVKYRGWIWAASGGSAEFFADLALTPWEMIKVKMQCSPTGTFPLTLKNGWHEMAVHKMETGFPYGSLKPVWYRQIPYTIVKFVGFEFAAEQFYKYVFTRPKESYSKATQLGITFLSGYVAGIGCALVSQPADNLVSQMAKPENFGKSFMEMAKQEGIKNLFLAGLGPRILMVGTLTALQWWIFDAWKTAMGLGTSGGGAVKKTDKAKTQVVGSMTGNYPRSALTQPLRPPSSGNNPVPPPMLGLKEYLSSREQEMRQVFARRAPAASQFPVRSLRRRIRSARPRGRLTAVQMARLIERRATVPTTPQRNSRKAKRRMMSYWEDKGVLATHRWHAKRFEMAGGVPLRIRDKGERAIYRIASHRCVVLDRSFWPCAEVECRTPEALESGLEEGLRTSPSLTKGVFASDNALRATALLYSTKGEVLSPIYLLREGKSARKALVWIHPSGAEHLKNRLSGRVSSMVKLRPTDLSWFALRGPRARQVVTKALGVAPSSSLGEVVRSGGVRLVTTTQGCDVVASEKIKEVFRKLVFAGASAIGQEDWEKLHRGVPCFPVDYPDSPACRRRSAEHAKAVLEWQSKRPGALKWESLAIESPLFADWSLLADLEGLALPRVEGRGRGVEPADLVCVRLTAETRGVPSPLAHVYAVTEGDEDEVALYQPKEDGESVRQLIGFVTSGGYGYRQGCGVAIAFIQLESSLLLECNAILWPVDTLRCITAFALTESCLPGLLLVRLAADEEGLVP